MQTEETIRKLRTLRLATMADSLRRRLDQGDHLQMDCEQFFATLVDDEVESRATKRVNTLLRKANLRPEQPCIEDIRYDRERGFSREDFTRFSREDWILRGETLLFTGATGTGKSWLAEALIHHACRFGLRAEKIGADLLLEKIRASRALGQYSPFLKDLARVALLVIDDFALDDHSKQQYCELLHIFEDRQGRRATIVTAQIPPNRWHERIPDPTVADAICDRLLGASWHLALRGPSLRRGGA